MCRSRLEQFRGRNIVLERTPNIFEIPIHGDISQTINELQAQILAQLQDEQNLQETAVPGNLEVMDQILESEDEEDTFILNFTAISLAVAFASIFTYFYANLLMLITHQFILFLSSLWLEIPGWDAQLHIKSYLTQHPKSTYLVKNTAYGSFFGMP